MYKNEIRVKVNGGYLVAGTNTDNGYNDNGIYVVFETDKGDVVDVAMALGNDEKVEVYCYEDTYTEDCTTQYAIDVKDIYKALYD